MREEAWQGSPHVEAGCLWLWLSLVPAILHPGPQVWGCGALGAERILPSGSARSAVFWRLGQQRTCLWERVCACMCVYPCTHVSVFLYTHEYTCAYIHTYMCIYTSTVHGASLATQMVKNPPAMQDTWDHPWIGKIPWRRKQQPTPIFLLRKSHGQRSLVGYSPWRRKEADTTERLTQYKDYIHDV